MTTRTIFDGASPKTQSIEAVKALLVWKGRAIDPLPSKIEFVNQDDGNRLMLILSNKKNSYYVTTAKACSCPAATYHPGQSCKHQRKHFPVQLAEMPGATESGSIRPAGKWPGGLNGPVDELKVVA